MAIPDSKAAPAAAPDPELKALADSCMGRKFETLVAVEGRSRGSRVRICGEPGLSDADWLNTLRSSIRQTEANGSLSQPVKDQIIGALKAEIARLQTPAVPAASTAQMPAIAFSPDAIAPREPAPQYSTVPPMPAPKRTVASTSTASQLTPGSASQSQPAAPLVRPRLTIRCAVPRESFEACARLERESRLLIRADEDLAAGTSLRFLRGGDKRAELDLGVLKKGQSLREKLPGRVCSGVMRGKVEVQILNKNRVAETLGPYSLYCGS